MDTWGTYTRTSTSAAGEETSEEVLLQADPINRARYERKGYTYLAPALAPGVGPAIQGCGPASQSAAVQMFGFLPEEADESLDEATVVKQAQEIAIAKLTGTYVPEAAAAPGAPGAAP